MKSKAVALSLAKSDLKVSVPKTRKASAAASCGRSPETWLVAPDSRPAAGQASRTRPANRVYARGSSAIGRSGARCRSWVQPETVIAWRRPRESPNRRERDASGHERALCRVVLRGGEGGKHGRARDCWPNNTKPGGIVPGLRLTVWSTCTGGPGKWLAVRYRLRTALKIRGNCSQSTTHLRERAFDEASFGGPDSATPLRLCTSRSHPARPEAGHAGPEPSLNDRPSGRAGTRSEAESQLPMMIQVKNLRPGTVSGD